VVEARVTMAFGRPSKRVHAVLWALPLALACAGAVADPAPVKKVDVRQPISVAGQPNVYPALLARVRTNIAANERLGELQEGLFCRSRGTFSMNKKLWEIVVRAAARAFRTEMTGAGHPRPGQSASVFEDKPAPTEFDLGMMVQKLQINVCTKTGEALGGVYVEAKWELYAKKARKVVFDVVTEGSYQNDTPEKIGFGEMIERAFAAATRNMLAEQKVSDYLTGVLAPQVGDVAAASETVVRGTARTPEGGVARNATLLRAAVVTVEAGAGTGSGFFISSDGYLITNQHVVGDAKFVRIKLATGRELVGEVLKTDRERDVALLKTEAAGVESLSVRNTAPNIGEDVFAIGSPLGERFSGSLTRGVLSGHRTLGELRYLQSDVAVLPGSGGGPLIDSSGSVVGISARALDSGRANLNLFIPIGEALTKLSVRIGE
jgi:S1-C subfamily serine protease